MIPEREREALMRLTMCARIECDICKYKESSIDECEERITQNMNILANALRVDRKTEPQTMPIKKTMTGTHRERIEYTEAEMVVEDEPQTEREGE